MAKHHDDRAGEPELTKFAFWEYDQPPYVVGTETDGKRDKEGTVSVPSYGRNARVKPLKIMEAQKGRETLNKLKQLDAMRREACNAAYRLFKADALEAAPFMLALRSLSGEESRAARLSTVRRSAKQWPKSASGKRSSRTRTGTLLAVGAT